MKQFSSTELANATGDVLAAVAQAPVVIARHGKPRFVDALGASIRNASAQGETRRLPRLACGRQADKLIAQLQDSIDNG